VTGCVYTTGISILFREFQGKVMWIGKDRLEDDELQCADAIESDKKYS